MIDQQSFDVGKYLTNFTILFLKLTEKQTELTEMKK